MNRISFLTIFFVIFFTSSVFLQERSETEEEKEAAWALIRENVLKEKSETKEEKEKRARTQALMRENVLKDQEELLRKYPSPAGKPDELRVKSIKQIWFWNYVENFSYYRDIFYNMAPPQDPVLREAQIEFKQIMDKTPGKIWERNTMILEKINSLNRSAQRELIGGYFGLSRRLNECNEKNKKLLRIVGEIQVLTDFDKVRETLQKHGKFLESCYPLPVY